MRRLVLIAVLFFVVPALSVELVGTTDYATYTSLSNENKIMVSRVATSSTADLKAKAIVIHASIYGLSGAPAEPDDRRFKGVLYDAELNLVDCTAEYVSDSSGEFGWWYLFLDDLPALDPDTFYYPGIWISDDNSASGDVASLRQNTSGGDTLRYKTLDYDAESGVCPDPLTGTSCLAANELSCYIYAVDETETEYEIFDSPGTWDSRDTWMNITTATPQFEDTELRTGKPLFSTTTYNGIYFDPDSLLRFLPDGASIDSIHYRQQCKSASGTDTLSLWALWKPFKSNNMTGTAWHEGGPGDPLPPDSIWGDNTAAPADSADDAGADNRSDGDDEDRNETSMMDLVVDTTGWYSWTLDMDIWDDWVDGTRNQQGFVIGQRDPDGTSDHRWHSGENESDHTDAPAVVIHFTEPTGVTRTRKLKILEGHR